jgi:ATP-dependent DNA ligase
LFGLLTGQANQPHPSISRGDGARDHGVDKTSAAELRKRLEPLVRKTQPYAKRIPHKDIWVEPKLLAEIEYRAKSAEGKVRHPHAWKVRAPPVVALMS